MAKKLVTTTSGDSVVWHVNDLKLSHKEQFEVTNFATYMSSIYRNNLTLQRGNSNDHLGIDLE